jgi:oxygen-independent coproporphyrinogen-3 oxidase
VPETEPLGLPPLSLYVHLPWCVRKCPYCDFNSHELKSELPAAAYVDALLRDLEVDLPLAWGRTVHSVFIGGGTPSLFPARELERLLSGIRGLLPLAPDAEITLEANPGTVEHDSFVAYREAGVNRVSLGIQSFQDELLRGIGRIHGRDEALKAAQAVSSAGYDSFNLDLMFALPEQSLDQALDDVRTALSFHPPHLSHYQLTIEPNTAFHARPPALPAEDLAWDMQERCGRLLDGAAYRSYEISARAREGRECRHNLNYWRYGDFIGIGAGAHGKLTLPAGPEVRRRVRLRHPRDWMRSAGRNEAIAEDRTLAPEERVFEFFLNNLRLRNGVDRGLFEPRTGVPWKAVEERVASAVQKGLLEDHEKRLRPTQTGWRFVNEIQALFLP